MKILKLLLVLLIIGTHAHATGYAHNMFVAHQKLRNGKEVVVNVNTTAKKLVSVKPNAGNFSVMTQSASPVQQIAATVSDAVTLNERILDESPKFLLTDEQGKESEESLVAKLIGILKNTVCAFVASLTVRS